MMEALLNALNVGGDLGVWVLILVAWKLHDRLLRLELQMGRLVSDAESEKRTRAEAHRNVHDKISGLGERVAKIGG